jgi:hypothetical protein
MASRPCYRRGGCADIIAAVADQIDARQFNPAFPQPFPRFVQHAIWRYCSQSGLDVCNGNRIDDTKGCANISCRMWLMCDRVVLRTRFNKQLANSAIIRCCGLTGKRNIGGYSCWY